MSKFGAFIHVNGNPFVTPDSTPFCLYRKVVINSSGGVASGSVTLSSSYPAIVFCKTSYTQFPTVVGASRNGDSIGFSSGNRNNEEHALTAYIFAIFPQSLPKWGLAIWDQKGQLVLTNESRVLSDLLTIGTPGNNGGINIDQTLSGSYAVCPGDLGALLVQYYVQGQPQIVAVTASTCCRYNGSTTRINAGTTSNDTGSMVGNINNGNGIIAIKTDNYD